MLFGIDDVGAVIGHISKRIGHHIEWGRGHCQVPNMCKITRNYVPKTCKITHFWHLVVCERGVWILANGVG